MTPGRLLGAQAGAGYKERMDPAESDDWRQRALTTQLAAARVRALGGLANAIAHDLANLLGAGIGLAELLRPHARDAADGGSLDELVRGARQGAILGRALARLLAADPGRREVTAIGALVDEVVALAGKSALRRAVALSVAKLADPAVRVAGAEVVQALLAFVAFGIDRGARRIAITVDAGERAIAGGRVRPVALVAVAAEPLPAAVVHDAVRTMQGGADMLAASRRCEEVDAPLVQAVLAIACGGGETRAAADAEGLRCMAAWPIP